MRMVTQEINAQYGIEYPPVKDIPDDLIMDTKVKIIISEVMEL